jgi:uncharacterized membrane protein
MQLGILILLIVSVIFKLFPPKKVNNFYGYRTSSSMRNIDAWKLANDYSGNLMLFFFSALTLLSFGLDFLNVKSEVLLLFLMVSVIASVIILTERKLRKRN